MVDREQVVATARAWLKTPFRPQARVRGHGADCVGLAIGVGKDIGDLPDGFAITYKQVPDNRRMQRECDKYLKRVPVDHMQLGDVVLIQTVEEPHHMGILVDHRSGFGIVHALKARGEVVEHRLDSKWRQSIVAAYRYPSVA